MTQRLIGLSIFLTVFSGCYKNHLYVQQEWVDRNSLASTKIETPDPRQENPPEGQRLIVSWKFPSEIFCDGLKLALTVRFWDNSEERIVYSMPKARSYQTFPFYKKKILTYKVEVLDACDEVIEVWEHHFWTKLISF